jgi:hypothetical protein
VRTKEILKSFIGALTIVMSHSACAPEDTLKNDIVTSVYCYGYLNNKSCRVNIVLTYPKLFVFIVRRALNFGVC